MEKKKDRLTQQLEDENRAHSEVENYLKKHIEVSTHYTHITLYTLYTHHTIHLYTHHTMHTIHT